MNVDDINIGGKLYVEIENNILLHDKNRERLFKKCLERVRILSNRLFYYFNNLIKEKDTVKELEELRKNITSIKSISLFDFDTRIDMKIASLNKV